MNTCDQRFDAVVVGAGPAGATTARELAARGRATLLVDSARFPRRKSCGGALAPPALAALAEIGVLDLLPAGRAIHGIRVVTRGHVRQFDYSSDAATSIGRVLPRIDLDSTLVNAAKSAGVVLWEGATVTGVIREKGEIHGVELSYQGALQRVCARVTVGADGCDSVVAREAGLGVGSAAESGEAVAVEYEGVEGLGTYLELHLPAPELGGEYLEPSYGWVFPIESARASVGVGLFHAPVHLDAEAILGRFVDHLRSRDRRFANALAATAPEAAPISFDFLPEACHAPGVLLVGDAAGMINPFTGEGLSYAIESGLLAAEVIDEVLREAPRTAELTAYERRLAHRYAGFFEAGREAINRYMLLWRVIDNAFADEGLIFALTRRALLLPHGPARLYEELGDVSDALGSGTGVGIALAAVNERLVATIRREWPFLAVLFTESTRNPSVPLRPALLFLLIAGWRDTWRLDIAAAVELAAIGALAHSSVGAPSTDSSDADLDQDEGHNWATRFALMVGDLTFARALELAANVGGQATRRLAEEVSAVATGGAIDILKRDGRSGIDRHLETIAQSARMFFEVPCRLAAELTGLDQGDREALGSYGTHLGIAHELREEVRIVTGGEGKLGRSLGVDLRSGRDSLPLILARQDAAAGPRLGAVLAAEQSGDFDLKQVPEIVAGTGAIERTLDVAREHVRIARESLTSLSAEHRALVNSLERIADRTADRLLLSAPAGRDHRLDG